MKHSAQGRHLLRQLDNLVRISLIANIERRDLKLHIQRGFGVKDQDPEAIIDGGSCQYEALAPMIVGVTYTCKGGIAQNRPNLSDGTDGLVFERLLRVH